MGSTKERRILGKSQLVPSVQELAKAPLERIPERYIRPNHEPPISSTDLQLPVIDMSKLISTDESELKNLHSACQEWGFFQLINHGVSSSLVEKFKLETQDFFNLPFEEKKKFWQTETDIEGFGQAFVVSEEQKLDWADMFYLVTLPKHQRKSYLFPKLPFPYSETLESYSAELLNLGLKILECMAKALNIDAEKLKEVFGQGHQSFRMNYYPKCREPEKVIGLSPHSDSTVAFTILLQLNEMEGLQVQKDGKWVPVNPLPHAFVVNVGGVFEIVTNGIYRSVLHRAVVNASKERMSVATFYTAADDREIGPIADLITPQTPRRFKTINMGDYWKAFLSRPLDGKSYLDFMRINETSDSHE